MYNINIRGVYTPCGEGKEELFKPVHDFDTNRKDVRILVWGNHGETSAKPVPGWSKTHCALIENIENLLDQPNKMNHKFYYCDRCTYWFKSQIEYDKHVCGHSFKSEVICPKKKHITFINQHKRRI